MVLVEEHSMTPQGLNYSYRHRLIPKGRVLLNVDELTVTLLNDTES